jgi:hypothetical protein
MQPNNYNIEIYPTEVVPKRTNYIAIGFFSLLVVGFTFNFTTLLFSPLMFFIALAGVIFLGEMLLGAKAKAADPVSEGKSLLFKVLKALFVAGVVVAIGLVGLIVLFIIIFSSGGMHV